MMRFMDPFEEMDRMMSSFGGRWRGGASGISHPKKAWGKIRYPVQGKLICAICGNYYRANQRKRW